MILIPWLWMVWGWSLGLARPYDDMKNLIFYVAAAYCLVVALCRRRSSVRVNPVSVCVLAYMVAALVAAVRSPYNIEGVRAWVGLGLWLGVAWMLSHVKDWTWLMMASVINAAVIAGLQLCALHGWVTMPILPVTSLQVFPIGHVSYFGDFMALHVPLAVYLLCKDWRKPVWAVALCLCTAGVLVSGTRAALVGLVAGWLLTIFLRPRQALWAALLPAVVLTSLWLQPVGLRGRVLDRLQSISISQELAGRQYFNTVDMIAARPGGWGLNSFRFVYPQYQTRAGTATEAWFYYHPHNEVLHQLAEVGVLGCVLWVVGLLLLLWYGWRSGQSDEVALGMSGLVVAVVAMQFDTSYLHPLIRALAAFYVALIWRHATFPTREVYNVGNLTRDRSGRSKQHGGGAVETTGYTAVTGPAEQHATNAGS
jgi:hypothetical protein